jgi:tartrate dehydrogenase/decarboxylase/D-malate dehydrogenase
MFFVNQPQKFEVVVTSNLFGDILTDLGAAIAGGIGLAAGANLNPERKYPSMFEPVHGSAPGIAGKNIANPLAAIWSASQMLDFFGYDMWGEKIIRAIESLLIQSKKLTQDMGGTSKTNEVGDEICCLLSSSNE